MPRRFGGCRLSVCMTSPSPRRSARILGEPDTSSESPWNQATFADPFGPDGALGRHPDQPGVEPGPGHPQESDHACHCEVALLHQHQLERLPFVSEASWAKKSDALLGLQLSTGVEPPASTSLTFSFGEPCHRRCSVIYGATSTRWNDFSGGQPGYTTSLWSAHMDRDRRGLSDGGSGRGVAGGSPTSVVSEHRARLFHLFGAVVDLPGAARRGGQVAGSRCAGSVRFLGMAA